MVHQAIAQLGKAFGDDARSPLYIETLSRVGYRLVSEVSDATASEESKRTGVFAMASGAVLILVGLVFVLTIQRESLEEPETGIDPGQVRIVIVPFKDLSPDSSLGWLADGLTADLRQALSGQFSVVGTTNQTAADVVLSGSVQEVENRFVASVENLRQGDLIDWADDFSVLSAYDHDDVRKKLSASIARMTYWARGAREYESLPAEAWRPYYRFTKFRYGGDTDRARYWLERTLDVAPEWGDGWMDLAAFTYGNGVEVRGDPSAVSDAARVLAKAKSLGANETIHEFFRAWIEGYGKNDPDAAERILRPADFGHGYHQIYAVLMVNSGLYDEAIEYLRFHVEVKNPFDVIAWRTLAIAQYLAEDYHGSVESFDRMSQLAPDGPLVQLGALALAYLQVDQREKFDELMLKAEMEANSIGDEQGEMFVYSQRFLRSLSAHGQAHLGDRSALITLGEWWALNNDHWGAIVSFLAAGDTASAELHLREFKRKPIPIGHTWHGVYPFVPLDQRNHPVIRQLKAVLGFTDEWRLELCRRASRFPPESKIGCDPSKYSLLNQT